MISKSQNKRYLWADIIRILAIYLVFVVHSLNINYSTINNLISLTIFIFAKTCVPLLVVLSGALLLSKQESYKLFLNKRFSRVLFPWIFWTIVTGVWFVIDEKYSFSIKGIYFSLHDTFLSFWFLPMIVGLYLLTPAIRKFVTKASNNDIIFLVFLWFITISLLPFTRNTLAFPRQTDNSLVRQVMEFIGYYLTGYLIVARVKLKKIKIIYPAFLVILGIYWSIKQSTLSFQGANQIDTRYLVYHSPGIVITSLGVFTWLSVLVQRYENLLLGKFNLRKIITSLSNYCLGIYLSSVLVDEVILKNNANKFSAVNGNILGSLIYALIYFLICLFSIILLGKIPLIKKYIS